ncbi:seryl-tRNA synthetase [Shewanella sp. cp20]|nr:seryl-tRNA synthetase [Shewanella sp. cp20]
MDNGGRYFQWLTYVVIICIFAAVMLATFGKAIMLVMKNL